MLYSSIFNKNNNNAIMLPHKKNIKDTIFNIMNFNTFLNFN